MNSCNIDTTTGVSTTNSGFDSSWMSYSDATCTTATSTLNTFSQPDAQFCAVTAAGAGFFHKDLKIGKYTNGYCNVAPMRYYVTEQYRYKRIGQLVSEMCGWMFTHMHNARAHARAHIMCAKGDEETLPDKLLIVSQWLW